MRRCTTAASSESSRSTATSPSPRAGGRPPYIVALARAASIRASGRSRRRSGRSVASACRSTIRCPDCGCRAEGYLAATSNTLQLGGRLDVGLDAGIASVSGFLGVDAIIQFTSVPLPGEPRPAGSTSGSSARPSRGVRFDGEMAGPGPVTLHGKITVETFIKDFDWEDTFVFGEPDAPPGVPPQRAAQILVDEEFAPGNLRAVGGADPSVMLSRARPPARLRRRRAAIRPGLDAAPCARSTWRSIASTARRWDRRRPCARARRTRPASRRTGSLPAPTSR